MGAKGYPYVYVGLRYPDPRTWEERLVERGVSVRRVIIEHFLRKKRAMWHGYRMILPLPSEKSLTQIDA